MTEHKMIDLLRARHPPPAWAFLEHVANGTGANANRTADAVAMSLWPSRGLELHGFEVKVWRGDWIRELKDPAKADDIASRCDRWWIAVADETVARVDEVPRTWGLIVATEGGLKVLRDAPLLTPEPLDRVFLAALLRRAAEEFTRTQAEHARGARLTKRWEEKGDVVRQRARLRRLKTTASRIHNEIESALYDLEIEQAKAERGDAEGGA